MRVPALALMVLMVVCNAVTVGIAPLYDSHCLLQQACYSLFTVSLFLLNADFARACGILMSLSGVLLETVTLCYSSQAPSLYHSLIAESIGLFVGIYSLSAHVILWPIPGRKVDDVDTLSMLFLFLICSSHLLVVADIGPIISIVDIVLVTAIQFGVVILAIGYPNRRCSLEIGASGADHIPSDGYASVLRIVYYRPRVFTPLKSAIFTGAGLTLVTCILIPSVSDTRWLSLRPLVMTSLLACACIGWTAMLFVQSVPRLFDIFRIYLPSPSNP